MASEKPRICLLTAYTSSFAPLAGLTVPRLQALADRHGYCMRAIKRDDCERGRAWIKVEPIRAALSDDFDAILWIDVDALVVRFEKDIRRELRDDASLHMAWHSSGTVRIDGDPFIPHFNCGVMLISVGDWSRGFFARLWDVGQLDHAWSDQATVHHLLGYDNVLGIGPERPAEPNRTHVARLDPAWNSIPGVAMAADPIVHHYAGIPNMAVRLRLVEADMGMLPSRDDVSANVRQALSTQISRWRHDAVARQVAADSKLNKWAEDEIRFIRQWMDGIEAQRKLETERADWVGSELKFIRRWIDASAEEKRESRQQTEWVVKEIAHIRRWMEGAEEQHQLHTRHAEWVESEIRFLRERVDGAEEDKRVIREHAKWLENELLSIKPALRQKLQTDPVAVPSEPRSSETQ